MIKLYETQSQLRENETVISFCKEEDGKIYIGLEQTIFFPEEGGQYADTGSIIVDGNETVKVIDGQLKGDEIFYEVDKKVEPGTKVLCKLDWDKRFMRMQNHTGEHILTGAIHNKYGYENVGFHLSDDGFVTMDMSGSMTLEQVYEMESLANEIVASNLKIYDKYPSKDEEKNLEYRSKIDIEGQVRLIQIGEDEEAHDVCACCAPHVAMTGEVGLIKVVGVTKYKGGVRISMLCGMRALEYVRGQLDMFNNLATSLSTNTENVKSIVDGMKSEISELKQKLSDFTRADILKRIDQLGEKKCLFVEENIDSLIMKDAFNSMADKFSGYVGIFVGNDTNGYRYNCGSKDLDSRELAAVMREKFMAKGGGNEDMIQGKIDATKEQIISIF